MLKLRISSYLVVCFCATAIAITSASRSVAAELSPTPLARQIDHIIIQSDEPEKTFKMLSETLALSIAWPFQSYGSFSSGAVNLGNVALEVIQLKGRRPGFAGVVLEPLASQSVPDIVRSLKDRGVAYDEPEPTFQKDQLGKEYLAWTLIGLPHLAPAGTIYFCKFNYATDPVRLKAAQALRNSGGGALGVDSVRELVIGARNISVAKGEWTLILGMPRQRGNDFVWDNGSGPLIHLTAAPTDQILLLRVKVKSLQAAQRFLSSNGLLGSASGTEVSMLRSHTSDAEIHFVE
jgi:hypothetical protein